MNKEKLVGLLSNSNISILILFVFYLVGAFGISFYDKNQFISLSPVLLGFSSFLLLFNAKPDKKKALYFIVVALSGFFIEVLGVKTSAIFGAYSYGSALGPKLFDVPVLIGLNWMMLAFSAGVTAFSITSNRFFQPLLGTLLLVVLDVFMESVSCGLDFWCFSSGSQAPPQNFLAWFIVSMLFIIPVRYVIDQKEDKFPVFLMIAQFLFFVILNLSK